MVMSSVSTGVCVCDTLIVEKERQHSEISYLSYGCPLFSFFLVEYKCHFVRDR